MAITMDGIFINGQKVTFHPENILTGDASVYTQEIGTAVEEWLEDNVTGGEQVTDTTLTLPGVPADAEATGDKIDELKEDLTSELLNGNAFDILTFCNHPNQTHRGVTFTWNGLSCTATGTATDGAAVDTFFDSANGFPFGMHAGGTYRLKHTATNVKVQIYAYINGVLDTSHILVSVIADKVFTVPSDATGIFIRLAVSSGVTVDETVSPKLYTDVLTNLELTGLVDAADKDMLINGARVGESSIGTTLNDLYAVDKWRTYAYADTNSGKIISTSSLMSVSENLIPIPRGTKIHVHGALKIFLYANDGTFIETVIPAGIDSTIPSTDAAYIRIQYGSVDLVALGFAVAYRYSAEDEVQSIKEKIDTGNTGVQQTGASVTTSEGNPLVLTGCDQRKPYDIYDISGITSGENIVICRKNIFAIRHTNGTFTKNGVTFTFNTINHTIRIRSNGATAATTSGFTEFGNDFKTINGVTFYHHFKFRFHNATVVSISENPNAEVPFDFGVQMRVYDGTTYRSVGDGGRTFIAFADTEYGVYFIVNAGWSGDITYAPQVEINPYPTSYERFTGVKAKLLSTGILFLLKENICLFECGGVYPGRYTVQNGAIKTLFDSADKSIYINAHNGTSSSVLIYDTAKTDTVNGNTWSYIYKFTPGETPVYVKSFENEYAGKIAAQISDGTSAGIINDYTGEGIFFNAESGKEYAYRIYIRPNADINAVIKPVISTGYYAIRDYGTIAGTTVIYTDKNATLSLRQHRLSTLWKAEKNLEVCKNSSVLTGDQILHPYAKIMARGPMVSFIDDDTTNKTFVQRYHDIFAEKGQLGGYAVETINLDNGASEGLPELLLDYEEEGFACLYHCYHQAGDSTRYWIKGHPDYDKTLINENFMRGLRSIREYGFSNYKYWVTPYGVNDKYIVDLAKNHGMQCLLNCPSSGREQHGLVTPYGNVSRWNIPRVIFGNYNGNDDRIHEVLQNAKLVNGWVIIVSHVNSWGSAVDEMGTRLSNLVQYCMDEGIEIVPFPVGFEEYRASFMLNELF